jgi:hypothetical protein
MKHRQTLRAGGIGDAVYSGLPRLECYLPTVTVKTAKRAVKRNEREEWSGNERRQGQEGTSRDDGRIDSNAGFAAATPGLWMCGNWSYYRGELGLEKVRFL